MRIRFATLVTATTIAATLFVAGSPAHAGPTTESTEDRAPAAVGTSTSSVTLSGGERVTVVTQLGRAQLATAADLDLNGDLAPEGDGPSLAEAAATSTIYSRTWSQTMRGLYYYNWAEKHSGKYYYNGTYVWSTTQYLGYTGYHQCDQGYGFGYSITVTNCPTYGTQPQSAGAIQQYDYFQVHVIANGIPIYASYNMHANMYPSGSIYFH